MSHGRDMNEERMTNRVASDSQSLNHGLKDLKNENKNPKLQNSSSSSTSTSTLPLTSSHQENLSTLTMNFEKEI